eukprot:6515262-Prorocentrum_lima.AAC.1
MKQAAPDSVRSVSYYGEFVLVLARKPGSPCHLKRWYVEEGVAEVRFLSAYPSGEYECIRLFTQCKHTCLLKRWYVEEGAFEVSFLAEYGSGEYADANNAKEKEIARQGTKRSYENVS